MAKELKELTPRSVSYSQWYQDLVIKADLADTAEKSDSSAGYPDRNNSFCQIYNTD
jgi:hypothetical protein